MNNNLPGNSSNSSIDSTDSQLLLNKIVIEYMRDQKRKRFWRWLTRAIILLVLLWVAFKLLSTSYDDKSVAVAHVGLIDIKGTIAANQEASGENLAKAMDSAYSNSSMKALILRIDSPGGSPVQADYMYSSIRYYRKNILILRSMLFVSMYVPLPPIIWRQLPMRFMLILRVL